MGACLKAVSAGSVSTIPTQLSAIPSRPTPITILGGTYTVNQTLDAVLEEILINDNGMILFIRKNDTPGVSNCTGSCAQNWPPDLVTGQGSPAAGLGVFGQVGLITRTDGSKHVANNGLPLCCYSGDKLPGPRLGRQLAAYDLRQSRSARITS
jgi:predicted lipoprotein with Yx(FWY)xxD motif